MSNSFFSALLRKHLVDFGLHRFGSWIIDFLPILIVEMHILDNKAGLSDLFAIYWMQILDNKAGLLDLFARNPCPLLPHLPLSAIYQKS